MKAELPIKNTRHGTGRHFAQCCSAQLGDASNSVAVCLGADRISRWDGWRGGLPKTVGLRTRVLELDL